MGTFVYRGVESASTRQTNARGELIGGFVVRLPFGEFLDTTRFRDALTPSVDAIMESQAAMWIILVPVRTLNRIAARGQVLQNSRDESLRRRR